MRACTVNGEPKWTGGDDVKAMLKGQLSLKGTEIDVPVADLGSGFYSGTYIVPTPGRYLLFLTVNGEHVQTAPNSALADAVNSCVLAEVASLEAQVNNPLKHESKVKSNDIKKKAGSECSEG